MLCIAPVLMICGCTTALADATVTGLHDGVASFTAATVDAFFQSKFWFLGDSGNDMFIHN